MTVTLTHSFNRDDIRRVYASFAAEYKIAAEWTGLHTPALVTKTIEQIKAIAEEQYLQEVHMQLQTQTGAVRNAAVYRVSANASGWSSDRPGDIYWQSYAGDSLQLIIYFTKKWWEETQSKRDAFTSLHMPGWGVSDFDGNYGAMTTSSGRRYASAGYGMERTDYST
jgi:Bacterial HORMA domain family 1